MLPYYLECPTRFNVPLRPFRVGLTMYTSRSFAYNRFNELGAVATSLVYV